MSRQGEGQALYKQSNIENDVMLDPDRTLRGLGSVRLAPDGLGPRSVALGRHKRGLPAKVG